MPVRVSVWSDDGTTELNSALLCESPACPEGGPSQTEGMACLSGSRNVLYTTNNGTAVDVWSMNLVNNQAPFLSAVPAGGQLAGLAVNGAGTLLYASGGSDIFSLSTLTSSPWAVTNSGQTTIDNTHDLGLGICAANTSCSYGGNIFTTDFRNGINLGINEYAPNPNLNQPLPSLGQAIPVGAE